ncbi:MAG: efflux RND transporter permease subunit [Peptococcaceae bacterium]|jgi:HAE1 family hydrophobic/amphiphilic exporter-1|nr:efflux RND transporter permease subunit [Peptococcaceae bacterium]MDH7524818.1 efflux RND transporter permease subunit [Peptococcaceae bacterium]
MKLSDASVRRPVAVTMLFLIIILLGAVSVSKLNMDLLPELNLPMALAMTTYEGVGPEEIENLVTRPIESVLGTVNGIKNISSTSSLGRSMVMVEFAWGTDMNFALNQMREKLDLIANVLPSDAGKTTLIKMDPNLMPVVVLGFGGSQDLAVLDKLAADVVKPRLERVEGVASVSVEGGVQREIRVSVVPQRLQAYGLSLDRIVSYLRAENRNTSAGTVEEGQREHVLRVTGEFRDAQEIENLKIPLSTGGYIRLGELARVEDTFKEKRSFVYMDGAPGIQISIQKQTDANTVKVSDAVSKELEEIKKYLPKDAQIKTGFDQAEFIRLSIRNVTRNILAGSVLAVFVLLLFLRNLRSTLIIGTAIPISVIATFILMFFGGLTLNMVSMGGLALGVGMMVDNAIVILENIYRHRREGYSRVEAATRGSGEVGVAIVASTLTSIVVFLPIVYVEGLASQIFRPMALTVSFSLLSSLAVALTLVPMLSSKILKVNHAGKAGENGSPNGSGGGNGRFAFFARLADFWYGMIDSLDAKYRVVLHWAINNKKKVVFLTAGLLAASLALIPAVGMEFMPKQDSGEYTVSIALPNGTALRETQRVTELMVGYIHELPEHEWTFYAVGSGGGMIGSASTTERAFIRGRLVDKSKRQRGIDQILDELRRKCAGIPGARINISAADSSMGGSGAPIEIRLTGDNLEVLRAFSEAVAARIKTVDGVREARASFEEGRPELHIRLNREKADLYGINVAQLSSLVAATVNGSTATKLRSKGEEIDVTVIVDEKYRKNVNDLKILTVPSSTGALIPLGDVADFETTTGPTSISRINQSRRVSVTGDISGRDLKSVITDIQAAIRDMNVPPGIQVIFGGSSMDMMESFRDLGFALILAIILVYMILASQYESLLYPFAIMFALPPTVIGVVFSLLVTGRTFNVPAFIGVIMLAGIVVNNAIVLVDYINTLRRRDGLPRKEAILKAGPTRLRPILMTTLTTILGLVPLVLGLGEGSEMSAPMATAVFGGLSFSTLITLVLVPCMYIILEDAKNKLAGRWRRFRGGKGAASVSAAGGEQR